MLGGDDAALEKLWKKQYSLKEFTDPKSFKTYEELKTRLRDVLGDNIRASTSENAYKGGAEKASFDDEDVAPVVKKAAPQSKKPVKESTDDDTEDALSYFEKLASED